MVRAREGVGTVVNATTITVQTPLARVCTTSNAATATVRVVLANGSCADAAGPVVTFFAPTVGSVDGLPPITALNPGPILLTGSNFPPIGTPVEVVFAATAGTPFGSGTAREGRAVGFVNPLGFLQVLPPTADVCPPLTEQSAVLAGQDLDRDAPALAEVPGPPDRAHPPAGDLVEQDEPARHRPRSEPHPHVPDPAGPPAAGTSPDSRPVDGRC